MPEPAGWSLHPQLERDTFALGDLALSRVLVIDDANYPWLLLVPRRAAIELVDFDAVEQAQLMSEIARTAAALRAVTECHKLNIAALGNVVPQFHVHIIARFRSDAAWPKPVWGLVAPRAYEPESFEKLAAALRAKLWID